MKEVKYIEIKKDSHFEYHLPCGYGLLDNSIFNNTVKLKKKLNKGINKRLYEKWDEFLWDSGITEAGTEENSLLYSLIVKLLSKDKELSIVTFGDPINIEKYLNPIDSKEISWKLSFQYTNLDDKLCQEFGYQTPKEFLEEMNYSNRDLSNRGYQISKLASENVDVFIKTYNSDVTSWSFLVNLDWRKLADSLKNKNKRPTTLEMLKYSDYVINVQIGGDEGYLDYVFIQCKTEMRELISSLEKAIYYFGNEYEKLVKEIGVIESEWKIDFFQTEFDEIKKASKLL